MSKLRPSFSIKVLLLTVSVIFIGLVFSDRVLKRRTSSETVAFGTTFNGLHGAENVRGQLETVLALDEFEPCGCPDGKLERDGDSWYSSDEQNMAGLHICFRINESYVGANVHVDTVRWIFAGSKRTDAVPILRARALAAELQVWWENAELLTAKRPIDESSTPLR